jgi:hypothetical protein
MSMEELKKANRIHSDIRKHRLGGPKLTTESGARSAMQLVDGYFVFAQEKDTNPQKSLDLLKIHACKFRQVSCVIG